MVGMKPQLPKELEDCLPEEVVAKIYGYVQHYPKKKSPSNSIFSVSPNMERDLRIIQSNVIKGKSSMFMRDLEQFILE